MQDQVHFLFTNVSVSLAGEALGLDPAGARHATRITLVRWDTTRYPAVKHRHCTGQPLHLFATW